MTFTDSVIWNNSFNVLENLYDQYILLFRKKTNFRINLKQTVYTFVFAPQDTLFQLYQKMYIKSWTTSVTEMNTVAFKLLVVKQTVLHLFYSRQLLCMPNRRCTLQLTAWTKFSFSCIYLFKHFSKKFTKVWDFTSIHIVLPQSWIPKKIKFQFPLQLPFQLPYQLPFQLPYPEA